MGGWPKWATLHFQQSCAKPVRVFDEYSTSSTTSKLWRGLSWRSDSDRHASASTHATSARRRSWLVELVTTLKPGRFTSRLNPVDSVHPGSLRLMSTSFRLCGTPLPGRQAQVVSALSLMKPARRDGPLPAASRAKELSCCPYEQYDNKISHSGSSHLRVSGLTGPLKPC
jgi:hypothetical protein